MSAIFGKEILDYIYNLFSLEDEVLKEMERFGKENDFPIIDRYSGSFLNLITKIKKPELVVELGSGFGYSAYYFAKALENGKVVLIDYQERNIERARYFFEKGGLTDKAEFRVGDAVEIAKEYKDIDILFLDLEKLRYLEAVKTLEENLSEDAIIIADNVLWHGNILSETDRKAERLREFNSYMSERYRSIIIPVGDGLLLSVK
ncbi:MAG TPA: O-methyltransferase [Persephonella sp.]|uniref:O-methyltransferase, family 3 n=1 Tax=Persephonella marina (strain DSM 14350 / EX-H1) TaxID=123214 RepID=C0QPG9_PERMH|nr:MULTISPECIES: O-methyltransferase [Persephonella]ACO04291.1 O-methyltransferase, family 3 [Persephonella marina EX-H1]HCB69821.1 O-methyltransferase [Persephonella sp.]